MCIYLGKYYTHSRASTGTRRTRAGSRHKVDDTRTRITNFSQALCGGWLPDNVFAPCARVDHILEHIRR